MEVRERKNGTKDIEGGEERKLEEVEDGNKEEDEMTQSKGEKRQKQNGSAGR